MNTLLSLLARNRRLSFICGSVVVGAVLLGLLWIMSPKIDEDRGRDRGNRMADRSLSGEALEAPEAPVTRGTSDTPLVISRDSSNIPIGLSVTTKQGFIEVPDEQGRVAQRYQYQRLEPLAGGRHLVEGLRATIFLSDTRLIRLTADEGEIQMPEVGRPEKGNVRGNVLIEVFEAPDVRSLNPDDALASMTFQVEAESLSFDLIRNLIVTDEYFVIRGRHAGLAGRGLTLLYNDRDGRVEHVAIRHRDYLFYRPPPQSAEGTPADQLGSASPDDKRIENSARSALGTSNTPAPTGADDTPTSSTTPPPLPSHEADYYILRLSGPLRIARGTGSDQITISGNDLEAEFSLAGLNLGGELAEADMNGELPAAPKPVVLASARVAPDIMPGKRGPAGYFDHASIIALAALGVPQPQPPTQDDSISAPIGSGTYRYLLGGTEGLRAGDILITGTGELTLRPLAQRPPNLHGPEDAHISIGGDPVTIDTSAGLAECSRLEYRQALDEFMLLPDDTRPVTIALADQSGAETTSPIRVSRRQRLATFTGPGVFYGQQAAATFGLSSSASASPSVAISTEAEDETVDETGSQPRAGRETPNRVDDDPRGVQNLQGFTINWTGGTQVQFGVEIGSDDFGPLESINFQGDVRLDHSSGFTLNGDDLEAEFVRRPGAEESVLSAVRCSGNVRTQSRDGYTSSDQLLVKLTQGPTGDDPVPSTVILQGNVVANRLDDLLRGDYLELALVQGPTPSQLALPDRPNDDEIQVVSILADGHVELEHGKDVTLSGNHLVVDTIAETGTLTGSPVILTGQGIHAIGPRFEFAHESEATDPSRYGEPRGWVGWIIGPGTARITTTPAQTGAASSRDAPQLFDPAEAMKDIERKLDASQPDARPPAREDDPHPKNQADDGNRQGSDGGGSADGSEIPASQLTIYWQQGVELVERSRSAEFRGNVVAEQIPNELEFNMLTADILTTIFSGPLDLPAFAEGVPSDRAAISPLQEAGLEAEKRQLIRMTAVGTKKNPAEIIGQRFRDPEHTQLETLVALRTQIIEWDQTLERLEGIGDGEMLVVNDEPPAEESVIPPADPELGGPGETLFRWTGRMILDGWRRRMIIEDDVLVLHRRPDQGVLHLDCQKLQATIDTGHNVGPLDLSGRGKLSLKSALAQGGVLVNNGELEVMAQTFRYDERLKQAVLIGKEDQPVLVIPQDDPASAFEASHVIWDMYTNRFMVRGVNR